MRANDHSCTIHKRITPTRERRREQMNQYDWYPNKGNEYQAQKEQEIMCGDHLVPVKDCGCLK